MAPPAGRAPSKTSWLVDPDGQKRESATRGTLGGNAKHKIYGRLDCAAALSAIRRYGDAYTKHRVFFADEGTAVAAGYRPCGSCMRDRYVAWKRAQEATGGRP